MSLWERENRPILIRWIAVGALVLVAGTMLVWSLAGDDTEGFRDRPSLVTVRRVVSGHCIKVKPADRVVYAGIRSPYDDEPFHDEATRRNAELVEGRELRLRYDRHPRDRKERLFAYAFADDVFVNETLVREGLVFVRLTPETQRFAERLLDAQTDARKHHRGIWKDAAQSTETAYPADPKYGTFHRPDCEVAQQIKSDRRIVLKSRSEAFDRGFAPCDKCRP